MSTSRLASTRNGFCFLPDSDLQSSQSLSATPLSSLVCTLKLPLNPKKPPNTVWLTTAPQDETMIGRFLHHHNSMGSRVVRDDDNCEESYSSCLWGVTMQHLELGPQATAIWFQPLWGGIKRACYGLFFPYQKHFLASLHNRKVYWVKHLFMCCFLCVGKLNLELESAKHGLFFSLFSFLKVRCVPTTNLVFRAKGCVLEHCRLHR